MSPEQPLRSRPPSPGSTTDGETGSRISRREALRFLTNAGQALASSLEYETTLQTLADLAVPRVACYCVVSILEADGRLQPLAMAHVDPEKIPVLERVVSFPPDPEHGSPLTRMLEGREPLLVSPVTESWLCESVRDAEHRDLMRQLEPTSLILVPLVARGTSLGMLTFVSTRTDRSYRPDDLALARELGRIAAVAIDNARLYRQAQDAVRARDEVLRVVSHDLRNPLSTVLLGTAHLLEETPEEHRAGPFGQTLRAIRTSAERADRMINDLLDVARIEAGHLAVERYREPLAPLLREAVETHRHLAEKHRIELRYRATDSLPWVEVDHNRVLQILGNLVGNALKFTPEGGRVEVGAEPIGEEVDCYVSDTGPGIPPDELPHVFDRFWQARRTDRRGLGLGLAIVKGLVEAQGGRVWVESRPGQGSTFHFSLPRAPAGATA